MIVTGGGSGIGAGIVEVFAEQGAKVGFVDIAEDASRDVVARLKGAATQPRFEHCDITDLDALSVSIGKLMTELGGCDILVNNAACDDRHGIDEVTSEDWDARMAVNLKHHFFAAKQVIPGMKAKGCGSIINLGSISWHLGLENLIVYQTAKAAIEGLTRSLARELGRDGIRVNAIIPGNVQTPRQMRWYTSEGEAEIVAAQCLDGRIQPEDIANMALFLGSDSARFCTAHNYWVDAGWH